MEKRLTALLLALIMTLSVFPAECFARESESPAEAGTLYQSGGNPLYGGEPLQTVFVPERSQKALCTRQAEEQPQEEVLAAVPQLQAAPRLLAQSDSYYSSDTDILFAQMETAIQGEEDTVWLYYEQDTAMTTAQRDKLARTLAGSAGKAVEGGVEVWKYSGVSSKTSEGHYYYGFKYIRTLYYSSVTDIQENLCLASPTEQYRIGYWSDEVITLDNLKKAMGKVLSGVLCSGDDTYFRKWTYSITGEHCATVAFLPGVAINNWKTGVFDKMMIPCEQRRDAIEVSFISAAELETEELNTLSQYARESTRICTDTQDSFWREDAALRSAVATETGIQYTLTFVPYTYHLSREDAVAELRSAMVARMTVTDVYLETTEDPDIYSLLQSAMAHTGNPTEGDYLRWQYADFQGSRTGYYSGDIHYYQYHITFTWYTTAQQEASVTDFVAEFQRLSSWTDAITDYQKAKVIYDWLCENVTYDHTHGDEYNLKHTAYAAAVDRKCVCQGYSLLFYRLALTNGIDARIIAGDSSGSETIDPATGGAAHAWNVVTVNDTGYLLDATWGAATADASQYFLKGTESDLFVHNHKPYVNITVQSHYYDSTYDYSALGVSPQDYVLTPEDNGIWMGDITGDYAVTVLDLQALFSYLREGAWPAAYQSRLALLQIIADYNSDGQINILDYQLIYEAVRNAAP